MFYRNFKFIGPYSGQNAPLSCVNMLRRPEGNSTFGNKLMQQDLWLVVADKAGIALSRQFEKKKKPKQTWLTETSTVCERMKNCRTKIDSLYKAQEAYPSFVMYLTPSTKISISTAGHRFLCLFRGPTPFLTCEVLISDRSATN